MATGDAKTVRCGPMHCTLRRTFGRGDRVHRLLPGDERNTWLVHRGRVAVWWAAKLLGLKHGDEVLVPAYHCGSEIDPLVRYGLTVRAYDVGEDLAVRVQDVAARASDRTRAVYVIHYFGVAQDVTDLAAWCRRRKIKLIEDCAVALFAEGRNGPAGLSGDAAIFSFRKTLPVPDGGALVLRDQRAAGDMQLVAPPATANRRALCKLLAGSMRAKAPAWLNAMITGRSDFDTGSSVGSNELAPLAEDDRFDPRTANWTMSGVSRRIAASTDPDAVRSRRRGNFERLTESLRQVSIVRPLIATLPPGACPVVCPIVTERRNELYAALRSSGIAAIPWWAGCHEAIDWAEFPTARRLKQSIVALPVHQMLGGAHVDYMIDCVRRFSERRPADRAAASRGSRELRTPVVRTADTTASCVEGGDSAEP